MCVTKETLQLNADIRKETYQGKNATKRRKRRNKNPRQESKLEKTKEIIQCVHKVRFDKTVSTNF
jgi:hypothetical protein